MKKEFKYKATFESVARCVIDKDKDKYLSIASLEAIKNLLPNHIDFDTNYDLLGVASNLSVANRMNKNGHAIDTKTAIAINKSFIYKPLNLEHNRKNVVGFITNTGYSSYGDNQIITEETASNLQSPFNMAIGGVVFRIVNPEFADLLEQSSDPDNLLYQTVSASWECHYSDYYIMIGSSNVEEAEIIKDPKQIEELSKFLRMNGGENVLEDGTMIGQLIYGEETLGVGAGFTTRPAAQVKGVVTANEENKEIKQKTISHSLVPNVKDISMKNITSLEEIYALSETDLKEGKVSIASMVDTIKTSIKEASEKYVKEKAAREDAAKIAAEASEKLNTAVAEMNKKIQDLTEAQAKERAEVAYNNRMTLLDSEFDLTDDDKKAVASDIAGIGSDDDFTAWYNKFSVYAAAKKKAVKKLSDDDAKKAAKKKDKEDMDDDDDDDSDDKKDMKAAIASEVEKALKTAQVNGITLGANSVGFSSEFKETYKNAFGKDGIEFKK